MTVNRLASVVLLLGLAGCLSEGSGEREPTPPEDDPVGQQWLDRAPLPECGTLDVDQGDGWRQTDPEAFDCFDDALRSGDEAELAVVYPTVEGDPIRVWYRLTGAALEVYEDASADSYGGDTAWTYRTCDAPERMPRRGHPDCS